MSDAKSVSYIGIRDTRMGWLGGSVNRLVLFDSLASQLSSPSIPKPS